MYKVNLLVTLALAALGFVDGQSGQQSYTWKNVKIGGGGGFVPGIVFNPSQKVCKSPFIYGTTLTTNT